MPKLSAKETGTLLAKTGRLSLRPLCIYSSDETPLGIKPVSALVKAGNRCLIKSMILVAAGQADGIYVPKKPEAGACPGSVCFLGQADFPPFIYGQFSNVGNSAMFLKESQEIALKTVKSMGKVTFPGEYLIIQACDKAGTVEPLAYVCIGVAESIRNICGLIHFGSASPFGRVDAAWGSGCETFISYPAGMAAGAPKDTAFIGPNAPDGNEIFPESMMAIGIPASMADRIVSTIEQSFVYRSPDTTYPQQRDEEIASALNNINKR